MQRSQGRKARSGWGGAAARRAFEERGFTVHTPSLRYHELPIEQGAQRVAPLSLRDFADDLVALVDSLDSPPMIVGHSMGGLLAKLVGARTRHSGLIAATPAPARGIFALYPGTMRLFFSHYLQSRPWAKPLYPTSWKLYRRYITNASDEQLARELYDDLVCESGRVYCEMAWWFLDRAKASAVDSAAVGTPVLAVGGRLDRTVNRRVAQATAKRYSNGTYLEIPESDHLVFHRKSLPVTMAHIDEWLAQNRLRVSA